MLWIHVRIVDCHLFCESSSVEITVARDQHRCRDPCPNFEGGCELNGVVAAEAVLSRQRGRVIEQRIRHADDQVLLGEVEGEGVEEIDGHRQRRSRITVSDKGSP